MHTSEYQSPCVSSRFLQDVRIIIISALTGLGWSNVKVHRFSTYIPSDWNTNSLCTQNFRWYFTWKFIPFMTTFPWHDPHEEHSFAQDQYHSEAPHQRLHVLHAGQTTKLLVVDQKNRGPTGGLCVSHVLALIRSSCQHWTNDGELRTSVLGYQ